MAASKTKMNYSNEIKSIIDREGENGGPFWSRADGDIHAPHGNSTMDTIYVLGELGATIENYPFLSKAFEFLFEYQTPDGSFKYSKTSSKLPCMTARILAALGRIEGFKNKRTEMSYLQLLGNQSADGGWRCNTVKLGKSPETDASNPGTTLYVLDAFRFRNNSKKDIEQLDKGIEFILKHWTTRKPLGPCTFGIGSRFFKVEFPFLRYNLFYFVYTLSFYPKASSDHRFLEAYYALAEKTDNERMILENPHRVWRKYEFAKKGKPSELATLRWKEIVQNVNSN